MSLVISDTTPLNYLILIGQIDVLPNLFGKLLVPPAVIHEMQHSKAPAAVSAWANDLPPWIEVKAPHTDLHLGIGAGEDEAISLAVELGDASLLMDDLKAKAAAKSRGLRTIGTITILDLADEAGLLDFEAAISLLKASTFHLEESLLRPVLAGYAPARTPNQRYLPMRHCNAANPLCSTRVAAESHFYNVRHRE